MRKRWVGFIAGSIVGTTLTVAGSGFSNQEPSCDADKNTGPRGHAGRRSQLAQSPGSSIQRDLPRSQRGAIRSAAGTTTVSARRGAVGGWTAGRTERRRSVPAELSVLPPGRRHGITSGDQVCSRARAGIVARAGATAPAEGGDGVRGIGGARAGHSSAGRSLPANPERRPSACRRLRTCRKPTSTPSTPT